MKTLADYIAEGVIFRPFDNNDWDGFNGCETENPMIGESENTIIIIDGNAIEVYDIEKMGYGPELVGSIGSFE